MRDQTSNSERRRAAFDAYYTAHPEKLKGKSLDEAHAAMRREVAHKLRGGANPGDKGFVGPVASKNSAAPAASPSKTPVRTRGRSDLHYPIEPGPKANLPGLPSKKTQQKALDGIHNAIARRIRGPKKFGL